MPLHVTQLVDGEPALTVAFPDDVSPMVGRDPGGNDLVLHHPTVSRIHARITQRSGEVILQDLGSRTGTWVNGDKLGEPHVIQPTDVVSIGRFELRAEIVEWRYVSENGSENTVGMNRARCVNPDCSVKVPRGINVCVGCGWPQR